MNEINGMNTMSDYELFVQMAEALKKAMPAFAALDYTQFGSKYKPFDQAGKRQYQGLMLRCHPERGQKVLLDALTTVAGTLSDRRELSAALEAEFEALLENPSCDSSLELRNPPHVWGGAILIPNCFELWGLAGQPEIVNHLAICHLQMSFGQISPHVFFGLIDAENPWVQAAMSDVGMSLAQYEALSKVILEIIEEASSKVRG